MQFSDTTNKSGIIQTIENRGSFGDAGISGNPTLLKYFTSDINNALSRAASIIIKSDGHMRWDDPNHSNTPVADFNLETGVKNYSIFVSAPTVLQDWLEIDRVEILDESDNGVLLTQKNSDEINEALSEFDITNGTPKTFRLNGTEIFLDPAPSYDKTAGGTIYFNRCPSYFASTDTTKRSGIPTIFHELLVLWPLYNWGMTKDQNYTNAVRNEITLMERELEDYFGRRNRTNVNRMKSAFHDTK